MGSARLTAARGLMEVFGSGGYSNIVLDHKLEQEDLSPQDRSFCAALFYGVIEQALALDYAIGKYSSIPVKKLSPGVLAALRCGFYQLLHMPSVPPSAAVNETVTITRQLGERRAAGFVNGVLRSFLRAGMAVPEPKDKLTALSVAYSIPAPLIQYWRKSYGQEMTLRILEGSRGPAPIFARVNTCRTTAAELTELLAGQGVQAEEAGVKDALRLTAPGSITRLPAFQEGLFHIQDLSSQLCAAAADPRPGMRVLDVCAAPGGKSFTMAQLMENQGELVCCDLHPHRVRLIEEGAARLGLNILRPMVQDATQYNPERGSFDRVLCDVVCSGYGILRRKPEIRYKPLETLDGIWLVQYNILETSAKYCKEGGRLVYSTCTLNPQENQQVVQRFLDAHREFRLVEPMTTLVKGELDCDGFFYAVLERKTTK